MSKKKKKEKIDDKVMSGNCDIVFVFPINGQFGDFRKPDSGCMVSKTYFYIISNLLSYKN